MNLRCAFCQTPYTLGRVEKSTTKVHGVSLLLMTILLKGLYTDFLARSDFFFKAIESLVNMHAGIFIEPQCAG